MKKRTVNILLGVIGAAAIAGLVVSIISLSDLANELAGTLAFYESMGGYENYPNTSAADLFLKLTILAVLAVAMFVTILALVSMFTVKTNTGLYEALKSASEKRQAEQKQEKLKKLENEINKLKGE